MTPKPFPFPITVGTDICQISRIFRVLASARGSRFVDRILTPSERAASAVLRDGKLKPALLQAGDLDGGSWADLKRAEPQLWKKAQFMAGR
jgi:holo-[acyl-carrier protein] synthase